ncbi:MAG: hypothetical protein INF44_02490 [Thalassospira sp.]|nr:hypothetical protein [Thalassospira sp.]
MMLLSFIMPITVAANDNSPRGTALTHMQAQNKRLDAFIKKLELLVQS